VSGDAAHTPGARRARAFCFVSILLVSFAQLALKSAVEQLPPLSWELATLILTPRLWFPLALLAAGASLYALSMICWFFALRRLPLSYAYSMLSLSYVLVYLLAVILPWLNESVTFWKTLGMALIVFGVRRIHSGGVDRKDP
jgi:undecaprenyl phosphate-alpha-L-ara4N flippase subunit ArnF